MELDRQSMRVIPTAHITLGGIPTTIAGQVINNKVKY